MAGHGLIIVGHHWMWQNRADRGL